MNEINATITRIDPLTLSQNTAVGRDHRTKPVDWYIYHSFAGGMSYWNADPHPIDAGYHVEFVCAVIAPKFMVGSPQDIRRAIIKHATDLGLID